MRLLRYVIHALDKRHHTPTVNVALRVLGIPRTEDSRYVRSRLAGIVAPESTFVRICKDEIKLGDGITVEDVKGELKRLEENVGSATLIVGRSQKDSALRRR